MTMLWLVIASAGYALNAGAIAVDKLLFQRGRRGAGSPVAYTIAISALGALAIFLAPFGWAWPGWSGFSLTLLAGTSFTLALLAFFTALRQVEASVIAPYVGALQPLFVLLFAWWLAGDALSQGQLVALAVLLLGGVLISTESGGGQRLFRRSVLIYGTLATLLFALSYALTKQVFNTQPFLSGFIWIRLGSLLAAGLLLVSNSNRAVLRAARRQSSGSSKGLFILGQALGALSALLVQYAISLGSVALVNALQGLQYVFLFLLVALVSWRWPGSLAERLDRATVGRKLLAIAIITTGLAVLALGV